MMPEANPTSVLLDIEAQVRARQHTLPQKPSHLTQSRRFLGFQLANTRLAIAATQVLKSPLSTRVPGAPPWLWGVAGLHGYPLPIIDFAALCQISGQTSKDEARVLVIHHHKESYGLLVESVYELVTPNKINETPPPELQPGIATYVHGSCHSNDTLWGIVDPARLFHHLVPMEKAG